VTPASRSGELDVAEAAPARAALAGMLPVAALVVLKAAVSAWALHVGFTHVSDDDYARITIAEAFAHVPRLDPSGTSWLPFPFWLNGTAMAIFGRSIGVAQAVALGSSVVGSLIVYGALIARGTKRWVAWTGVALAMSAPWSTWLGVATVPEALCASLVAAGALGLTQRGALWAALALLVASLSRYEAWPVAAVFAAMCLVSAARAPDGASARLRATQVCAATIAVVGPAAWLLWNWHAHGDAFHFIARVAAYRARVAPAATGTWALYPSAFVRAGPGTLALVLVGAPGAWVDPELRKRWAAPFVAMLALAIFLIEGDLHDGAPTHHPERALVALFWLGTAFGVDGVRSLSVRFIWGRPKREAWLVGVVTAVAVAWGLKWPAQVADYPAHSPGEDRTAEIARGEDLHARQVGRVTITPCAYEHFATIAAYGAPERVAIEPCADDSAPCPVILER
jgi:hypothetical protein